MKREPFTRHQGVAAPLMVDNIDTDQIIPSREMKAVSRDGLGEGLFAGWRYTTPGGRTLNREFVLNRPAYAGATILLAGSNFGCGSSREHAVWALAEFGVRAIIAQSFGAIFRANCARNGVVPIALPRVEIDALLAHIEADPQAHRLTIDLDAQTVSGGPHSFAFEINAYAKRLLLEGLDPISLTLTIGEAIDAFEARDRSERPWLYAAS